MFPTLDISFTFFANASGFLAFYEQFLYVGNPTKTTFYTTNLFIFGFLFPGFSILSIACMQFRIAEPCIKCFRIGIIEELLSRFFGFSYQSFTLLSHCVCKGCPIYTFSFSELIFFWMPADHWSVYTLIPVSGFFLILFVFNLPHIKCHNIANISYWPQRAFLFLWRSMLLCSCTALHFLRNLNEKDLFEIRLFLCANL